MTTIIHHFICLIWQKKVEKYNRATGGPNTRKTNKNNQLLLGRERSEIEQLNTA